MEEAKKDRPITHYSLTWASVSRSRKEDLDPAGLAVVHAWVFDCLLNHLGQPRPIPGSTRRATVSFHGSVLSVHVLALEGDAPIVSFWVADDTKSMHRAWWWIQEAHKDRIHSRAMLPKGQGSFSIEHIGLQRERVIGGAAAESLKFLPEFERLLAAVWLERRSSSEFAALRQKYDVNGRMVPHKSPSKE